jgi:hypothetical protein
VSDASKDTTAPRIFVSYRWSSPDHEEWVLSLATSLRHAGIDVVLDKWHLSEGQDTLAFMESMVSDPAVTKVLMVCDRGYVERANTREGGVGTEAQIISAKVYQSTDQNKFAAIVIELDADGRPMLPHYMATRLYFDMSTQEAETANFEKVVRWIFGKPFHALPPVGEPPAFLDETYAAQGRLRLEGSRLRKVRRFDSPRTTETAVSILDEIAAKSADFIIPLRDQVNAEEVAYQAILASFSTLEEVNSAFLEIVRSGDERSADTVHRFFERLLELWDYAPLNTPFTRWDNDVLHFFGHDCFVSFVALCIQERQFKTAADVLSMPFFKPKLHEVTGEAVNYNAIMPSVGSLYARNEKLRMNRISLHADVLGDHHSKSLVSLISFVEADITLYVRGIISPKYQWHPESAVHLERSFGSLPTYVRATSARFYERFRPLLLGIEPHELRTTIQARQADQAGRLRSGYHVISLPQLLNLEQLSTAA